MAEQPENKRDTQFAGFAKLLMHDLATAGFDEIGYRSAETTQKIIAQRAYDFLYFLATNSAGTFDVGFGTPMEIADTIETLPDLTEWPKNEGE